MKCSNAESNPYLPKLPLEVVIGKVYVNTPQSLQVCSTAHGEACAKGKARSRDPLKGKQNSTKEKYNAKRE